MKAFALLTLLPYCLSAVSAVSVAKAVVRNNYIVEIENLPNVLNNRGVANHVHKRFYQQLDERRVKFKIRKEFNEHDLFVGVALELTSAEDAAALASLQGVVAIRPVASYEIPKLDTSTVVALGDKSPKVVDRQASHIATGVDKVHALGITGKGIKVGLIDTGIDYSHPELGGGYGSRYPVAGGRDFVGDIYTGNPDQMIPDDDPADCYGHGTFVAGVLAAKPGGPFNISGVAPGAKMYAYKIFGCAGTTGDDVVVSALLQGAKDRMDILSLSLSRPSGWSETTAAIVAGRLAAKGIVVVTSAGNREELGAWQASSPGTAPNVISVGSSYNTATSIQTATVNGAKHDPIAYWSSKPLPIPDRLPICPISNDTSVTNDACKPLPKTLNLSSCLVLIRRGTCDSNDKLINVAKNGAKFAAIYRDSDAFSEDDVLKHALPTALIRAADGRWLVEQYLKGSKLTLNFPQTGGALEWPDPNGGLMSDSSYGPTFEMDFSTKVVAPGENILSLCPVINGSYTVQSGASFAAPFVAGVAALVMAENGRGAEQARDMLYLLASTAKPLPVSHKKGAPIQTLAQQGSGQIDAFVAITSDTYVYPALLRLNDTTHFNGVQKFTVYNEGKKTQKYQLTHEPAGTLYSFDDYENMPLSGPLPLVNLPVSVSLSDQSFTLRAGEKKTITAKFTASKQWISELLPVYSGFIKINSTLETLRVAYMGAGSSLKDVKVLYTNQDFAGVSSPHIWSNGEIQTTHRSYSLIDLDFPVISVRLRFGTPSLVVDLVHPDTVVPGAIKSRADAEGGAIVQQSGTPRPPNSGSFAKIKTLGNLFQYTYTSRNDERHSDTAKEFGLWEPVFSNRTWIPNGTYRILVRALKVTGDRTKQEDYESWLSPTFALDYDYNR